MTDNNTDTNAVWMSSCTGVSGQLWYYDGSGGTIDNALGSATEGFLRTSTVQNAVYATDRPQSGIDSDTFIWWGTHN